MLATRQIRDVATTARKRLRGAGFLPIPAIGKAPPIPGWQNLVASEAHIDSWFHEYPEALNTGIITRNAPAIDIDVYDPDMADELEQLLWDVTGARRMIRFGQPPKRAALFRTDVPFGKMATPVFTSLTQQRHRVEVLADGQQIVVLGTHPGTGKALLLARRHTRRGAADLPISLPAACICCHLPARTPSWAQLIVLPSSNRRRCFTASTRPLCAIKPQTLVIDTSADVYAGNENDRMQVRQFVGLLRKLAIEVSAEYSLTDDGGEASPMVQSWLDRRRYRGAISMR